MRRSFVGYVPLRGTRGVFPTWFQSRDSNLQRPTTHSQGVPNPEGIPTNSPGLVPPSGRGQPWVEARTPSTPQGLRQRCTGKALRPQADNCTTCPRARMPPSVSWASTPAGLDPLLDVDPGLPRSRGNPGLFDGIPSGFAQRPTLSLLRFTESCDIRIRTCFVVCESKC